MASLTARHLLTTLAHLYQQEREYFSKEEIVQRLNEIKYLTAQKKIPRLTLRKEIVHLEKQLHVIYELEKQLLQKERQESAKMAALKRQVETFRRKLAVVEDKDVHKKLEKLVHLLGDCMAKTAAREDVDLCNQIMKELNKSKALKRTMDRVPEEPEIDAWRDDTLRAQEMAGRLTALKQELEIQKNMEHVDPPVIQQLEVKITVLERTLRDYYQQKQMELINRINQLQGKPPIHAPLPQKRIMEMPITLPEKPKHTLLFTSPPAVAPLTEADLKLQKQLPLPPPPKMLVA